MGFDLFGINPRTKAGDYYRATVWTWHPLWNYVCAVCKNVLSPEDMKMGHFNDGHQIVGTKARKIAERLESLLNQGRVAETIEILEQRRREMPDEVCKFCGGTGVRNDKYVNGQCNACGGKGKVRPFETWYQFTEQDVRELLEFLKNCDGFQIW